jgi:hypothetical protein
MENISNNIDKAAYEKRKVRFIALNLFLFFICIYFLTTSGPGFYHGYDLWQLRLEVIKSIIERFDVAVPEGIGIIGVDGRAYSLDSIGSVILALPGYLAAQVIGIPPGIVISAMNQFFGSGTVVLVFLFCVSLKYAIRTSLFVSIFYGLGTIAWPLVKQPFDHTIETFFILLSIYLICLYVKDKKLPLLILSAFSLGFSFLTRPTSVLMIIPLFIVIASSYHRGSSWRERVILLGRDGIFYFVALVPFLFIFLWYNHYRFGSVFEAGYFLKAERLGIDFFTGTPLFTGLGGLIIGSGKGFFYYSPVALLFFFSIKSFLKKYHAIGISFILIIISYLLFLSRNIYWHGDWAWGPRYLLVITPYFLIPIAEIFEFRIWKNKKFLRVLVYLIFVMSIVIQIAAVSVDYRKYFFNLYSEEDIEFVIIRGNGVQSIHEPPSEIYFDWHKSPILSQFIFIGEITKGIKNYRYTSLPADATAYEKMKANPIMNIFDFWWLYSYFLNRSYTGIIVALVLFFIAIYTALKMWKLTCKTS